MLQTREVWQLLSATRMCLRSQKALVDSARLL